MTPVFITGTGTGIGKTVISAIVSQALSADYWKPVQAGNIDGTDTELALQLITKNSNCFPEVYNLLKPASPHIAAREENLVIDLDLITQHFRNLASGDNASEYLVIEGAGGLMVPLNEQQFVADLILKLKAKVILVSRNYLGSINHSLLTAAACKQRGINVIGWIFNDEYMQYQDEIAGWSGYPVIGSVPRLETIDREVLSSYGLQFRPALLELLEKG